MDLEARSLQPSVKAMLLAKLREYKTDLNNVKNEVKRITSANTNQAARDNLLESGMADTMTVCILDQFLFHSFLIIFMKHLFYIWINIFFYRQIYVYIYNDK